MGLALLFAMSTTFGVLFSIALLRADRTRWDNRVFAAMGLLDAAENGYRAIRLLEGYSLIDHQALIVCSVMAFPMAALSVEFAYSFPFNRPAPKSLRIPVVGGTAVAFALSFIPGFRDNHGSWQALFHSAPLFVVVVLLLRRNLRATTGDKTAVRLVGAALSVRWVSAIVTHGVARELWPSAYPSFFFLDTTVVTLLCYLLVTFAFLRSQLFSLRGFAAELLALAAAATGVISLAALAVEGALHVASGPGALRAALVLATLIPLAGVVAGARLGRGFQRAVARNIDPRRMLRERLLERAEATRYADPRALVRIAETVLAELSGGAATYLSTRHDGALAGSPALPKGLAERLAATDQGRLVRGAGAEPPLPYDLVVAVRSATSLHGAIAIAGGQIDRDTQLGAAHLADRLALALDAYALFIELEASRRLATLGAFAAAIAHDIRTPLTSVQMNVQILRKKVSLPPDEMEYFDIALEELRRLNANITELLDFAKPANVENAPLDLAAVIADARRTTATVLAERELSLEVVTDADTPTVVGDAARLRNVLENLVTNAANASPKGGRIAIRTRRADDGRAVLEVADEGPGIAPADLPRIFEPFFTTRPDGTGLGLAICDKLVRAQHGEIRVDGAPGEGATFAVLLPAAMPREPVLAGGAVAADDALPAE